MVRAPHFRNALLAFLSLALAATALADPCGMVPPIYTGEGPAIQRIGAQQTYVFYRSGIESFVIRPGFQGKVEDFGMLIPFPTPPAIRKVDDDIFSHLKAAVSPPEVVVDLRPRDVQRFSGGAPRSSPDEGLGVRRDTVRVLREEAVGMYEVAVLEAGSSDALKRWMDRHGYQYPDGMDETVEDYVEAAWCFVAVKTRVGVKAGVDPRPGMRDADPAMPPGSSFDGFVQAMGFRFRVDAPVVPMRLSAFNEGEMRNICYVLTDEPVRFSQIDAALVVRQIPGEDLLGNLTDLLPVRILGGTLEDLGEDGLQRLEGRRDPSPHSGFARELFASDLLAARTGRLAHDFEEDEKVLLRIGERLLLRGGEVDARHHAALEEARTAALGDALDDLSGMTLTVVDGDFPREVVAAENLTLIAYEMPAQRNTPAAYDANVGGPAPDKDGVLVQGLGAPGAVGAGSSAWYAVLVLVAMASFVLAVLVRRAAGAAPVATD